MTSLAASATTTSFVAGSTASLPVRNLEPVSAAIEAVDPRDSVLAAGFEIDSVVNRTSGTSVLNGRATRSLARISVDEALSLVLDEFTLDGNLD